MKKITIIATGGTIAGVGRKGLASEYEAGRVSVSEIMESLPPLHEIAELEEIQLMNVDSNEMSIDRWIEVVHTTEEALKSSDGAVITHGTDTLDEFAYFLTLTLNTMKPVVVTGAMRPSSATSADGPYNLYQAVCLAASSEAAGLGVLALFSNTIYSGRDIQKENNYRIDAFGQRSLGVLGYMQDNRVSIFSYNGQVHTAGSDFASGDRDYPAPVAIAYFYVGADPDILYFLAQKNEGIVIAGTGSGNYSEAWKHAIIDLSSKGIVFARSSRISQGIILDSKVFDPMNLCIPTNTLSPQKARVLLSLCLKKTKDRDQIRRLFLQY